MTDEPKKATTKETAPETTAPKKNNTVLIVVIVILVVVLAAVLGSCFMCTSCVNKTAKQLDQGQVKVGDVSVNTNQAQSWPKEIPSTIPQFTAGKIESSGQFGNVWTITISNINDSDFDNYKETLKSSGWTIEGEVNAAGIKSFTAKNSQGYQVNPMLSVDDKGQKAIIIGIILEAQK